MKRLSLAIIFACFTLAVAAQEGFRVDYQGTRPTIKDFVKAYLTSILSEEVEECEAEGLGIYESLQRAITNKEKGLPLDEGETLTIDTKNGFLLYEQARDENLSRIEMCFWNELLLSQTERFFQSYSLFLVELAFQSCTFYISYMVRTASLLDDIAQTGLAVRQTIDSGKHHLAFHSYALLGGVACTLVYIDLIEGL